MIRPWRYLTFMVSSFVTKSRERPFQMVLLFLLYLSLFTLLMISHGNVLSHSRLEDFTSFYAAAKLVFDEQLSPYTHSNWEIAVAEFPAPLWAFLSPPPSLMIFRIFIVFGYETAESVMLLLNLGLILAFALYFILKHIQLPLLSIASALIIAYIFTFEPVKASMDYGQVNILVLVLISISWYYVRRKPNLHPFFTALPLSIASILKLYPLLLFVFLFFRKKYKVVLWGLGLLVLSVGISYFVLPDNTWSDWVQNIAQQGFGTWVRGIDPAGLANQGINGFTARLFLGRQGFIDPIIPSPVSARVIPLLLSVLLIAAIAISMILTNFEEEHLDLEVSLFLVTMYLIAPLSWEHQLVFVLPSLIVVIMQVLKNRIRPISLFLLVPIAIVITLPIDYSDSFYRLGFKHSLLISTKFYAAVSLWLFLFLTRFSPYFLTRFKSRRSNPKDGRITT